MRRTLPTVAEAVVAVAVMPADQPAARLPRPEAMVVQAVPDPAASVATEVTMAVVAVAPTPTTTPTAMAVVELRDTGSSTIRRRPFWRVLGAARGIKR